MNRTFTIDEDIIRRLVLRRDEAEREHQHARHPHLGFRLWRGLSGLTHDLPKLTPRARWS